MSLNKLRHLFVHRAHQSHIQSRRCNKQTCSNTINVCVDLSVLDMVNLDSFLFVELPLMSFILLVALCGKLHVAVLPHWCFVETILSFRNATKCLGDFFKNLYSSQNSARHSYRTNFKSIDKFFKSHMHLA